MAFITLLGAPLWIEHPLIQTLPQNSFRNQDEILTNHAMVMPCVTQRREDHYNTAIGAPGDTSNASQE